MNKLKLIIALVFIFAAAYTVVMRLTLEMDIEKQPCTDGALGVIAPWSAGCFYQAYFIDGDVAPQTLDYEKQTLQQFMANEGVSKQILWYRAKFHQKFRNYFKTNFQELHAMHTDYTKSEHTNLENQVEYWHFLYANDLVSLSQRTLNEFCDAYIRSHRDDLVEEINWRLERRALPLNLDYCIAITAP